MRPLSDVVASISQQAGVNLTAGADVADEPAMLSVTNRPAREVMRQIAFLFNYSWKRTGRADPPRYELWQDARSRREEENLRHQDRQRCLDALEAEIIKQGQPALKSSDPCRKALFALISLLPGKHWERLVQGEKLIFSSVKEPGALPLPEALAASMASAPQPHSIPTAVVTGVRVGVCMRLETLGDRWHAHLYVNPAPVVAPGDRRLPPHLDSLFLSASSSSPRPEFDEQRALRTRAAAAYADDPALGAIRPFRMDPPLRQARPEREPPSLLRCATARTCTRSCGRSLSATVSTSSRMRTGSRRS
jgi:hypothetical protein